MILVPLDKMIKSNEYFYVAVYSVYNYEMLLIYHANLLISQKKMMYLQRMHAKNYLIITITTVTTPHDPVMYYYHPQ